MFCADTGFDIDKIIRGDPEEITRFARAADVDEQRMLLASARVTGPSTLSFLGEEFHKRDLTRSTVRVCPDCIREQADSPADLPARDAWWKVAGLRSCPHHGTMLISLPRAESSMQGHDFAWHIHQYWDTICDPNLRFARTVVSAFEQYMLDRMIKRAPDTWLNTLSFSDIRAAAETLGVLLLWGPDARLGNQGEPALLEAADTGFRELRKGPESLRSTLKDLVPQKLTGRSSFAAPFGAFYAWLAHTKLKDADVFKDLLREVIMDNYSVAANTRLLDKTVGGSALFTISRARHELGLSEKRLGKILLNKGLATRSGPGGQIRAHAFLEHGTLLEISKELAGRLSSEEAASRLGISSAALRHLASQNFIPVEDTEEGDIFKYAATDIDAFEDKLWRGLPVQKSLEGHQISFIACSEYLKIKPKELSFLICAAKLSPIARCKDLPGFSALCFSKADVERLKASSEQVLLTFRDFAKRMRISERDLKWLVDNKQINTVPPSEKGQYPFVAEEDGLEFFQKFRSLRDISSDLFQREATVKWQLTELGISPVHTGFQEPDLYLRQEITAIWPELLANAPTKRLATSVHTPKSRVLLPNKLKKTCLKEVSKEMGDVLRTAKKRPQVIQDHFGDNYVLIKQDTYSRLVLRAERGS